MDASETIQVNCLGAGRWGPNIIRGLRNLPHVQVRWVCDTDPGRLKMLRERMPDVATTTDADEVIFGDQADAVVIATPVQTHFDLAQRALRAGRHVFVEKPLAMSSEEINQIEAAMAANPAQCVMVGFNRRFSPHMTAAKDWLRSCQRSKSIIITVNAGAIAAEHWTRDRDIGCGRSVG